MKTLKLFAVTCTISSAMLCVGRASADDVQIDESMIVKTGAGTSEITASQIGSRSVRVEEGTLRIVQDVATQARYIRFTILATNPWRTTNKGELTEMASFQLVNQGTLVNYPASTTVENLPGNTHSVPASNILTYDRVQANDWIVNSATPGFVIDMKGNVAFDGYVIAPAIISTGRSPYSFTVEVGVDNGNGGIDWTLFDRKTQYCTAGYGSDWFTAAQGYAPRMPPVYAANPLPVFDEDATVTVAEGATLELSGVSGRVPNLAGSGVVRLADGRPELTGNCTFAGSFDGFGTLAFAMSNDELGSFGFASLAIRVENVGKGRTLRVSGNGEVAKLPIAADSADAPLDLVLCGTVETPKLPQRVDRYGVAVPFVRFGKTAYAGDVTLTSPASVPSFVKHFRYMPITGHGAYVEQVDEIKFLKNADVQDATDIQISYMDAYRTTNYTSGVLSDQQAANLSGAQAKAKNLFDSDSSTYFQYNQQTEARGELENTPGLTLTFRKAKCFDNFEFWQPHYGGNTTNPAYWPGKWRIETSVDGNVWEVLDDQSKEVVEQSRLYTGWPPVVTTPVASGSVPRGEAWFAVSEHLIDEDCAKAGTLKYLRIFIKELVNSKSVTDKRSFVDIGELELHQNGQKVAWPTGALAYRTDGKKTAAMGLINAPSALPGADWITANDNVAIDRGSDESRPQEEWRAIWDPGYAVLSQGAGFVVEMPQVPTFEEYKIFSGHNWDGEYRILGKWTIDVSYDGAEWRTVDAFDYTKPGVTVPSVWVIDQFYCKRSVDFSSVGRAKSDFFGDTAELRVVKGVTLSLANVEESIGGLQGAGTVVLTDSVLTVVNGNSTYAGSVSGVDGTLTVDGGRLAFDHAKLRGLKRIVLKNGAVLEGRAVLDTELVVEVGAGCVNNLRGEGGIALWVR